MDESLGRRWLARRLEVLGFLVQTFLVRRPCLVEDPFLAVLPCRQTLVDGRMALLVKVLAMISRFE